MNTAKRKSNVFIALILITCLWLFGFFLISNNSVIRGEEEKIVQSENQISAWETTYENALEFSEALKYDMLYRLRYRMVSSDLEFTEEQQKRVDNLLSKVDASLAELEESEDTSSVESDLSGEIDSSDDR